MPRPRRLPDRFVRLCVRGGLRRPRLHRAATGGDDPRGRVSLRVREAADCRQRSHRKRVRSPGKPARAARRAGRTVRFGAQRHACGALGADLPRGAPPGRRNARAGHVRAERARGAGGVGEAVAERHGRAAPAGRGAEFPRVCERGRGAGAGDRAVPRGNGPVHVLRRREERGGERRGLRRRVFVEVRGGPTVRSRRGLRVGAVRIGRVREEGAGRGVDRADRAAGGVAGVHCGADRADGCGATP